MPTAALPTYEERRRDFTEAGFGALLDLPLETVLAALTEPGKVDLPMLAAALVRADEAAPALISLIDRAAARDETLNEAEAAQLARGLFVLGAAREPSAFKPLLRLLALPDDDLDPLLGDIVTQSAPKIVAGAFDGDGAALLAAIVEPARDEYVRNSLLEAAAFLTWDGRIGPTEFRRFLERFDDDRLAPAEDYAWVGWVNAIAWLGFADLAPRVRAAWDRLPDNVMRLRDFELDLADALRRPREVERLQDANLGYIEDIWDEMSWMERDEAADPEWNLEDKEDDWHPPQAPILNPFRHVGRNDPCPCGSGKKAKKCCLSSAP